MKVFYVGSQEVMDGLVVLAESPQEAAEALGGAFIPKEKNSDPSESSKLIGVIRFNRNLFDPPANYEESCLSLGLWIYRCGPLIVFLDPDEDECTDEPLYEMSFVRSAPVERSLALAQCN